MHKDNLKQFITIGELAKRSGVTVATLRFYEEKQLIFSIRTNGNQRRYLRAMLRRVAIIKVAQLVGIGLKDIEYAFRVLPKDHAASQQDWRNMSKLWKAQLDEKIVTLIQLRQQLDQCIGCGCLTLQQCPLRNAQDRLSKDSTGAHFQNLLLKLDELTIIS